MLSFDTISYGGWPNCLRLSNGRIELIATTDVGPRVIRFGFVGGQNLFKEHEDQLGRTDGDEWLPYGGHRLWHAPEDAVRTYFPDNVPVRHEWDGGTLRLIQEVEETTGIGKELEITLSPGRNHVTVLHRLVNFNLWEIELAPWALSTMAPGGRAIVPQEPYGAHPDHLLPARPLVLWPYTNMADPRWTWGERYIQLRQDANRTTPQKLGFRNGPGWLAYYLHGELFLKRVMTDMHATYPDLGSNSEMFVDGEMLEVETLGPLAKIPPGGSVEHVEHWFLELSGLEFDELSLASSLDPILTATAGAMSI